MSIWVRKKMPILSYFMIFILIVNCLWVTLELPKLRQPARATANDMIIFMDYGDLGGGPPTNWEIISDTSLGTFPDIFYQRYVRGGATYGAQSGAATHTHTLTFVDSGTTSDTGSTFDKNATGTTISAQTHTHSALSGQSITADNNLPAYRSLAVLRYTLGIPTTLPDNTILLFETATISGNWELYAAQDAKLLWGNGATANGGNNTPTHSVASGLGAGSGQLVAGAAATARATVIHTHGAGAGVATDGPSIIPPYYEVVFQRATAAITSFPNNMIAGFSSTIFAGSWTVVSGASQKYNNLFLMGDSSGVLTSAGALTHSHANVDVTTGTAVGSANYDVSPLNGAGSLTTHTHSGVTIQLGANVDHTPLYTDLILAQYSLPYAPQMNNWRWYADEEDEVLATPYANETTNGTPNEPPQVEMGKRIPLKLRINITETVGVGENDSRKKLQWSTDQSTWTNIAEGGAGSGSTPFVYTTDISGGNDNVVVSTQVLTGTTQKGIHNESNSNSPSESDHTASATLELEYAFEIYDGATVSTSYYFQLYDQVLAAAIPLASGKCYPKLTTATAFDLSLIGPTAVALGDFTLGNPPPHVHKFTSGEKETMRDNRGVMADGWTLTAGITTLTSGGYQIVPSSIYWVSYTTDVTKLYAAPTDGMSGNTGSYMSSAVTVTSFSASSRNGHGGFEVLPEIRVYNMQYAGQYTGTLTFTIT